jgi:hypothetical protein
MHNFWRILLVYSAVVSTALVLLIGHHWRTRKRGRFEEITVQRINVVESNGTLRMVISNHARLPGIIVRGKEEPYDRPQAGMLFYNDEGSENGGLVFGGRKNEKGDVVDSGGSLSFDKYDANQIVQLAGVDDKEDRFAGLMVGDSQPGGKSNRRVWVGRSEDGAAVVNLLDGQGKKRIVLEVPAAGTPRIQFLSDTGKVLKVIAP